MTSSSTTSDRRPVHRDFQLVERDQTAPEGAAAAMRETLRSAWPVPNDTFITSDIPALLTILSVKLK